MINFLCQLYRKICNGNHLRRALAFAVRVIANIIIPLRLFFLGKKRIFDDSAVIVSLTTFPARINNVWKVIGTLLLQKQENIRIILWLSREEFPFEVIPKKLKKLCKHGLEIKFVDDNLRSHQKYYYAFREFPKNIVITVDDDIFYPSNLITILMKEHVKNPNCIICHRGYEMTFDDKQKLNKYSKWSQVSIFHEPRFNIMPTGVSGVLYPPGSYHKKIFDINAIKNVCFLADDLWLNFMCRLQGTKVVHSGFLYGLITIISSQEISLMSKNVNEGLNDMQIQSINEWAQKELGVDFLNRLKSTK